MIVGEGPIGASAEVRAASELARPDAPNKPEGGFEAALLGALHEVNAQGALAHQAAGAFAEGKLDDIHGTMIAARKADIELRLLSNVRTKVVDAINDLLRMSV